MIKLTDRELIALASNGEEMAFTALTNRYKKSLHNYICKLLSANKEYDAEVAVEASDICQESFQKAFVNLKEYNPAYEFSTWLYTIAKNTLVDYARKRKILLDAGFCIQTENGILNYSVPTEISPEERMISSQEYSKLIHHIESLPETYKEIAIMRFVKEYAYQEISNELNLPLNTVKTKIKRAKALLTKIID